MKKGFKYKNNNKYNAIWIIIVAIGIFLLVKGISYLSRTLYFNNNSEKITAYVDASEIDISKGYRIYVNYTFDGNSYNHILLSGLDKPKAIGEELTIRINPDIPEDIRYFSITTFYIVIVLVMGSIFLTGGLYLIIINHIKENSYKEIIRNGVKVQATITKVYPYQNVYNSKNQYYIIECEYVEKKFKSRPFKNLIDISEGDIVPVYYTSIRKGKIFVDVANTKISNKKDDNWSFNR